MNLGSLSAYAGNLASDMYSGYRGYFNRFTRMVSDAVDSLIKKYKIGDLSHDAIMIDPNLAGTSVGGYSGVTSGGEQVLGVSPDTLTDERESKEVAYHEASHSLLPIKLLMGLHAFYKNRVADISRIVAEADVVRSMVEDHGFSLSELKGYSPIKQTLYKIGRKVADTAGGAAELYKRVRDRGSEYVMNLINSSSDLKATFQEFLDSHYDLLEQYRMAQSLHPAFATVRNR